MICQRKRKWLFLNACIFIFHHWQKDNLITLILFVLGLFMIFSPVANLMHHPLCNSINYIVLIQGLLKFFKSFWLACSNTGHKTILRILIFLKFFLTFNLLTIASFRIGVPSILFLPKFPLLILKNLDSVSISVIYHIVARRSTSRSLTCLGLFRLLMKGIFVPIYIQKSICEPKITHVGHQSHYSIMMDSINWSTEAAFLPSFTM